MEVDLRVFVPFLLVVIFLYRWLTKNNDYFDEKPIPSMAAKPLLGSTGPLMLKQYSFNGFVQYIYDKYPNAKVFGMFDSIAPVFVVRDLELIKKITVKDFEHFIDHRPIFGDSNNDHPYTLFGKSLFAMNGTKWRDMRATLSPAFTGSKMRLMFGLMSECCESLSQYLTERIKSSQEVAVTDMFSRLSTDVIASCAFGFKMDSLRDRDNDFYLNGKKMMRFERLSVALRIFANKVFPKVMGKLGIDIIDREQARYFRAIITKTIDERQTKGIVRPDMINLLIQARAGILRHQQEKEQDEGFATAQESDIGKRLVTMKMTDNEMISQAFVFFLAGYETVTTTTTFLIHDLVVHQDVQQKLYEEIKQTHESLNGKPLTYDVLQKMKYLDAALSESMRLRPAAASLDRLCVKDYELDDGEGLKFTIEKGVGIWIPIQGIHMDSKYFPNPERFDPERFNDENKSSINPMAYLPFGVGPRNCIGSRFALMQVKAVIYHILLNFILLPNSRTQIPLKLRKGFTVVAAESEVYIDFKKRQ